MTMKRTTIEGENVKAKPIVFNQYGVVYEKITEVLESCSIGLVTSSGSCTPKLAAEILDFIKCQQEEIAYVKSNHKDYLMAHLPASSVAEGIIASLNEADVVEVVRCKDCIYNENGNCVHSENYDDTTYRPDYFCADGLKKEV